MPRVAVICLCFNQANYVNDAMSSVLNQTYSNWELIVVDNASTDNSLWEIEQFKLNNSQAAIKTLFLGTNVGICRAFNQALTLTSADYIIDLAADDILMPERLEHGVKNLELHPLVAVNFSNANYISETGEIIKPHYQVGLLNKADVYVPEGNIFEYAIANYFICSATMMMRASHLKAVGGYDEKLAYEDFDIIISLSAQYKFSYTDKILVQKRLVGGSWSTNQYRFGNDQLKSTLAICYKIYNRINTSPQKKALYKRIAYEAKQAIIHFRLWIFLRFISLGFKTLIK